MRPLDLGELLQVLAGHGVDYVVIGGVAVQVHGHRRTTMDLDLVPDPAPQNLKRLASALDDLDARAQEATTGDPELPVSDPERLALAAIVPPLSTRHGQLHIVNEPKGARPFSKLREAALVIEIDGTAIPIVSLDDLIRIKRASGRPSDLEDIAALLALEGREKGPA
jgi:hypothetical protein